MRNILSTFNIIIGAVGILFMLVMLFTYVTAFGWDFRINYAIDNIPIDYWPLIFIMLFMVVSGESLVTGVLALKGKRLVSAILAALNIIFAIPALYLLFEFTFLFLFDG